MLLSVLLQTFTPAKSLGARLVTEADILSEAAPHEVSDYLLQEEAATRPLCKLVDRKAGDLMEGGRKLNEAQVALNAARMDSEGAKQVELSSNREGEAGAKGSELTARSEAGHLLESVWLSWPRTLNDSISRFLRVQNLRPS